jgi:hypothetical protein
MGLQLGSIWALLVIVEQAQHNEEEP